MDEVCRDLDFVFVFIDDILVFSTTADQHREHLRPFSATGAVCVSHQS